MVLHNFLLFPEIRIIAYIGVRVFLEIFKKIIIIYMLVIILYCKRALFKHNNIILYPTYTYNI